MKRPGERIFGVETEFGTLVADPSLGTPEAAVETIKDHLFYEQRVGAIDLHTRDEVFEPAESGGFLLNGARLYIDAVGSHLEYATAECRTLTDLVANDRAGQRLIVGALKALELEDEVFVYNNSVDHFGGHTFGCHENYLVRADEEFLSVGLPLLYPFLVTRQIFAGVGRVGGHRLLAGGRPTYDEVAANPVDFIWVSNVYRVEPDSTVQFQLSQRADHILKTVAGRVRFNRALINPKWETYYTYEGMTRLHFLFGESNQNEYAYALKVGTTHLVLRLLEDGFVPDRLILPNPLITLRQVSRDQSFKWPVELVDGTQMSAIDLQYEYLNLAMAYKGQDEQTDWILKEWEATLKGLAADPLAMADRIDWVAKYKILEEYRAQCGVDWSDDSLHSVDLEYHNIHPEQSLFHALQKMGDTRRVVQDFDILCAQTDAPRNTRAYGRSQRVEQVIARKSAKYYQFDWNGCAINRHKYEDMPDPFLTYELVGNGENTPSSS